MTDLLAAVTAERLDLRWFATPAPEPVELHDDDMTTARRRRALAADHINQKKAS